MYKAEKILTLGCLFCNIYAAVSFYFNGEYELALAWGSCSIWCFNSLINLTQQKQS